MPIQERTRNGPRPHLRQAVPDTAAPDPTTFGRKKCNLVLIEVGFCRDFGCHSKLQDKIAKYAPLVASLQALWGKVEFVAVPIGHAGTTLTMTHQCLIQSMLATRPEIKHSRTRRQVINPDTDFAARRHDTALFKFRI